MVLHRTIECTRVTGNLPIRKEAKTLSRTAGVCYQHWYPLPWRLSTDSGNLLHPRRCFRGAEKYSDLELCSPLALRVCWHICSRDAEEEVR
jgi:hypothetical protein